MADVFTYVVSGIGITLSLLVFIRHNQFLREILGYALLAVALRHPWLIEMFAVVIGVCSLIGVYAPSVGFYVWCVVLVWLASAAVVFFRKLMQSTDR